MASTKNVSGRFSVSSRDLVALQHRLRVRSSRELDRLRSRMGLSLYATCASYPRRSWLNAFLWLVELNS